MMAPKRKGSETRYMVLKCARQLDKQGKQIGSSKSMRLIGEMVGVTESAVRQHFNTLLAEGYLVRIGYGQLKPAL